MDRDYDRDTGPITTPAPAPAPSVTAARPVQEKRVQEKKAPMRQQPEEKPRSHGDRNAGRDLPSTPAQKT